MSRSREPSYYEVALTNRQVLVAFAVLLGCVLAAFLAGVWVGLSSEPGGIRVASAATPTEAEKSGVPSLDLFAGEDPGAPPAGAVPALDPRPRPGTTLAEDLRASAPGGDEEHGSKPAETAPEAPPGSATPDPAPQAAADGGLDEPPAGRPAAPGNGTRPPGWRQRQRVAREAERLAKEFEQETAAVEAAPAGAVVDAPGGEGGPEPADARLTPAAASSTPAAPPGPEPAPSPASPAVPAGASVFVVQVLSTADQVKARELLESLRDGGYPATLSTLEKGAALMYRVRVGPYRDRPAAERVAEDVRRKFRVDTWITGE
jgi:DedD protein